MVGRTRPPFPTQRRGYGQRQQRSKKKKKYFENYVTATAPVTSFGSGHPMARAGHPHH